MTTINNHKLTKMLTQINQSFVKEIQQQEILKSLFFLAIIF